MLFEGRFGGNVYRPIGIDWFNNGFWKVYDHPATVEQFLGIGGATPDGSPRLNDVITTTKTPDPIYFCNDIDSGQTNKAITYDGFMNRHFDFVIATLPFHVRPFEKLCQLHPDKPKLIYQIGNSWTIEAGYCQNIMASARIDNVPDNVNFISYHQEFDTKLFCPGQIVDNLLITSFVNCFDVDPLFAFDWQLFTCMEKVMGDWTFRALGGQCRDGCAHGSKDVAEKIKESRFIWHTKNGGDGYGHIIHNVPACGKPLIVRKDNYLGKLAEPLLVDGFTCLTIDGLSIDEIKNKIIYYNEPERYKKLCDNAYSYFTRIVDFEKEFLDLQSFINRVK